jgi:hypothetical protein
MYYSINKHLRIVRCKFCITHFWLIKRKYTLHMNGLVKICQLQKPFRMNSVHINKQ